MVDERPRARGAQLPLREAVERVVGGPAVEEVALERLAQREAAQEAARELLVAAHEPRRVELVRGVAARLLALAAHPLDDRLLRRVGERVEAGLEHALQRRLRDAEARCARPRVGAAAQAQIAHLHLARGVVEMQLQEAQRLVVEALEAILALAADEARPREALAVEPGRAGGIVGLLRHELHHRSRGGLDGHERKADHLLGQLECQEGSFPRTRVDAPRGVPRRHGGRLVDELERAGDPELEPVARVAAPAHAARPDQAVDRPQRLAHERNLARAERGGLGQDAAVAQVVGLSDGRGGRAIGRQLEPPRREPGRTRREARRAPARGREPSVEVLLQRAQVPTLELAGAVRAVQQHAPALVAHELARAPARLLHAQREQRSRACRKARCRRRARRRAPRRRSRSCPAPASA